MKRIQDSGFRIGGERRSFLPRRAGAPQSSIPHSQFRLGGFTLVEILVAIGLSSLVFLMLGSMSVLLLRAQRQALLDVRVIDSARFATESLARTLRTVSSSSITVVSPTEFTVSHDGRAGGLGCPTAPCVIRYRITPYGGNNVLEEVDGSAPALPLTSTALNVEMFRSTFIGRGTGDGQQPRAVITLRLRDPDGPPASAVVLETTVSLRVLEF